MKMKPPSGQKNKPNSNPILSAVGGFQKSKMNFALQMRRIVENTKGLHTDNYAKNKINSTVFALCAWHLRLFMLNY